MDMNSTLTANGTATATTSQETVTDGITAQTSSSDYQTLEAQAAELQLEAEQEKAFAIVLPVTLVFCFLAGIAIIKIRKSRIKKRKQRLG